MAYVPEASTWTAGVYQLEVSDPVQGGTGGIDNQQATDLGNRTKWLKDKLSAVAVTPVWTEVVKTSTGDWTCPAGVTQVVILDAVAGGGGGGGIITPGSTRGGGGGGGARVQNILLTVVPATVYTLTVGTGGAGGTHDTSYQATALGADGVNSSFGALLVLGGGKGAGDAGGSTTDPGGAGGTVTVNGIVYNGGQGESCILGGGGYQNGGGEGGGYWVDTDSVVAATNGGGGFGGATGYDSGDGGDGAAGFIRFAYLTCTVTGNT